MAAIPQIRSIYALGSSLGINGNSREDELHQLVYGITGKESIKELTSSEVYLVQQELMKRMKGAGNIKKRSKKTAIDVPPGKMTESQQKKAWSLIYRLVELDPSESTPSERMIGAVKKILGMEINTENKAPFRMVTVSDGIKLIDMLKKYVVSAEKKAGEKNGYR